MGDPLQDAVIRGREDPEFWVYFFLGERLHAGQLEWITNSEAQVNVAATANRWGKTFVQCAKHLWRGFYKWGSEWRWLDEDGNVDPDLFMETKYRTLHCAQGWETTAIVWEQALKYIDRPSLKPFVKAAPRSLPPFIEFTNGWKWLFRTLGSQGQGVDGTSFYLITVDEAGWVDNLAEIHGNVLRLRVADVQGMVDFMGTFKPGVSRDFYQFAKRASVYTGRRIDFDFEAWLKNRERAIG